MVELHHEVGLLCPKCPRCWGHTAIHRHFGWLEWNHCLHILGLSQSPRLAPVLTFLGGTLHPSPKIFSKQSHLIRSEVWDFDPMVHYWKLTLKFLPHSEPINAFKFPSELEGKRVNLANVGHWWRFPSVLSYFGGRTSGKGREGHRYGFNMFRISVRMSAKSCIP